MTRRLHLNVPLRWGDADAYGHVNNVSLLALVEQARVQFFARAEHEGATLPRLDGQNLGRSPVFLTGQRVEYRAPLMLDPEPPCIDMWVSRIGGADFALSYELRQHAGAPIAAVGLNGLVFIGADHTHPRRMTAAERSVLERYLGPAVHLRH